MLSSEKSPKDPPCPSDEERAYGKLKAVDLLTSDLGEGPKFSIRDYVYCSRDKDITNNWPFSQNILQICLKHGVKNLLPPFQSPDLVRIPACVESNGESILVDKENACNSSGKPSSSSNHFELVESNNSGCHPNLFVDSSINPSISQADKEVGSTTVAVPCSNIDFFPIDKSSCLDLEAKTSAEPSEVSEVVTHTTSKKRESINQPSVKKCRLIVKYSNIPHSSSKEAATVNTSMSSEAMAVCPVCRTFSSSSNTTLNAHIDQCLSGEYTTKSAADMKVIRHRIKPRKMRSMVDIYKTAPHCTLEDLDRRNGGNWASNRNFSAPEVEVFDERNKQGLRLNVKETSSDGSVYVDANGTKLRILSKFSDPATDSKVVDASQLTKLIKGGKGSTGLLAKKIKKMQNRIQKQQKYSRIATHGNKVNASRLHRSSEMSNGQDEISLREENDEKDECMLKQLKASNQVKSSVADVSRGWASSKKTGIMKKINGMDDKQQSGECMDGNLSSKRNLSPITHSHVKKINDRKSSDANSPCKSGRSDNLSHELHEVYRGHPSLRKRIGSSVESESCRDRMRSHVFHKPSEHGVNHFRKNVSSDHMVNAPPLSKRQVETRKSLVRSADTSVVYPKLSSRRNAFLSRTRKFSSLRKKLSSASHASAPDSRFPSKRKFSAIRKSRVFHASESDEEEVLSYSGMDRSQDFMQKMNEELTGTEDTSSEESFDRSVALKVRSSGESEIARKEEAVVLRCSMSTSMHSYHDHDIGEENGSVMLGGVGRHSSESIYSSRTKDITKQTSEVAVGGQFMRFSNSLVPGLHELAASTEAQCNSQRFIEEYKMPLYETEVAVNSTVPVLSSGQDIFCANVMLDNMTRGNDCIMVGLDSSGGQGNYLPEVDQIPIPGPPGSFLPSPRHMDSYDLQGNSSLTSSRVQFPDDHQELADQSSQSPGSGTSTVSNSNTARPGSESSEKLSVWTPRKDVEISGSTLAASVDPIVENCSPVVKLDDAGTEIHGLNEFMTNMPIPDKEHSRYRNGYPCCCSRKGGFLQNIALNYHDSPLLQRRTTSPILVSSHGMQMSCGVNGTLDNSKSSTRVCPVPGDEGTKFVEGLVSSSLFNDNEVKFQSSGDGESVGPAPSTPVLRLMGKNLMVISHEIAHPQLKCSMSNSVIGHAKLHAVSGVYNEDSQNGECHTIPHMASQGPCSFHQAETCSAHLHHSDGRLSKRFANFENLCTSEPRSAIASLAMLMDQSAVRDFTGSVTHRGYSGVHGLPTQQVQSLNRFGSLLTYDREKVVAYPSPLCKTADAVANADKEVVVIDDNPENEINSATAGNHNQVMQVIRDGAVHSAGILEALSMSCDPQSSSPSCETEHYVYGMPVRSLVDSSILMPPPNGANGELVKWSRTLETSDVMDASTLNTRPSPSACLRSELFNPPGF